MAMDAVYSNTTSVNSKCPPISVAIEDTRTEAHLSEAVQESLKNTLARDQS